MKTNKKFIPIIASLLLYPSISYSDGNMLLENCTVASKPSEDKTTMVDAIQTGWCFGLMDGVTKTMLIMGKTETSKVCLPKNGIFAKQSMRIITSYLEKNPALLHEDEVVLTIKALIDAYPCK